MPNPRSATVDRLVGNLGDVCGDVADLASGAPPDEPVLRDVRAAVRAASDAIRLVVRNPSATRLPIVLAAWKAIANAREMTVSARSASWHARQTRTVAIDQRDRARQQAARIAALRATAYASRLERWLERRQRAVPPRG
jgi:hypothetical protein